jgi:sugar/nucleoside kinase (ribokinase family)
MIAARSDLLVIGALTIDRFGDGSSSPGGSVMHIARAAAARGMRVAIITVAGPEPQAEAGLDELRGLAARVELTAAEATATFVHQDGADARRLWLERRGGSIRLSEPTATTPQAILVAPIADEVAPEDLARLGPGLVRAAILQGYLRSVAPDGEIRPIPLSVLDRRLVAALSHYDLLVASREDLLGEAAEPSDQLVALRGVVGPRPALVVTDGVRGVFTEGGHLSAPRVVAGVRSVGAGDIFAAFMLADPWPRPVPIGFLRERAESAMLAVAEILEERSGQAR